MDRRESLKTLMVGTVAGATLTSVGCQEVSTGAVETTQTDTGLYGRTPSEKEWDERVHSQEYFDKHELETIAVLCDIILPATSTAVSATEAGVPDFVAFISKDLPDHQLPLSGGIMWLDGIANHRYDKRFISCSNQEQKSIIDDIAYPDPDGEKPNMEPGIKFFSRIRNLTLTGYYTSKMGMQDLGYKGNIPNIWDGVPQDVLDDHGVDYDADWLAKCVDQSKREVIAEWDEEGNLIT